MKFLLDTDTFSELARGRRPQLAARFARHPLAQLAVSPITVGEIRFGLATALLPASLVARTEALLQDIICLTMGATVSLHYAALRAHLRRAGTPIGPNDTWIAAHALAEDLTLVTGNEREFKRVPGLKVENWLRD